MSIGTAQKFMCKNNKVDKVAKRINNKSNWKISSIYTV